MPRYCVTIEGRDFLSASLPRKSAGGRVGFCVIRYVKAESPEEAASYVLERFEREIREKLEALPESRMKITRVRPVESLEGTKTFEGGITGTELITFPEPEKGGFLRRWITRLKKAFPAPR